MTKKLLALAVVVVALSAAPAFAQSRTYWPPGLERHEREITRQLNNEHGVQPMQSYAYPPQYSYAPPAQYHYPPQYSYAPQPTYAYPYDYPPRPWRPRYY
jgi:hypothetical protein